MTQKINGISVGNTYVILNGATGVTDVGYYTEEVKGADGKKRKERHSFFELYYGDYSIIRFERKRKGSPHFPHRHINHTHTMAVYADESLFDLRKKIITQQK